MNITIQYIPDIDGNATYLLDYLALISDFRFFLVNLKPALV